MQNALQAGIDRLYHYETFSAKYLKDTLSNNRIHVSNIANVNDPWDCRPWFEKGDMTDPQQLRKWELQLSPVLEADASLKETIDRMPVSDHPRLYSEAVLGMTQYNYVNNIERWRIYCLAPNPCVILMWSHYSDKHRGICLEFTTQGNCFGGAQKVAYRETFQVITPELLEYHNAVTETILLTKSQAWDYEEEYRLLLRDRKFDPAFKLTCENEYLPLPSGALTAVIAGQKCRAEDLAMIGQLIAKHAPDVLLKRAVCVPHKYEIEIAE